MTKTTGVLWATAATVILKKGQKRQYAIGVGRSPGTSDIDHFIMSDGTRARYPVWDYKLRPWEGSFVISCGTIGGS